MSTTNGSLLPDRVQTISAVAMSAYAGATWDWTQTHLDTTAALEAGLPAAIVDGQMLGALLAAHAQDGVGNGARVVALEYRNVGPVYRGETIRIRGRVVDGTHEGDGELVSIEQEIVVEEHGRAAVRDALATVWIGGEGNSAHDRDERDF